jgi:hypothetical protein
MFKRPSDREAKTETFTIDEIRLVADLRIMHAKVDELYQVVSNLKRRHSETAIRDYADTPVLDEDIARMDQIYLWFVTLKEEGLKRTG